MNAATVRLGYVALQGGASLRQHMSLGRAAMLKQGIPWEYHHLMLTVAGVRRVMRVHLKRLRGAYWGASDVGLYVRQSPLYRAALATFSHSANPICSPGGGAKRLSWDCYNPCVHEGELTGKVLRSALRRGRGGGVGGSTVKRLVQKLSHFLLHYHKGRMTPLLCDSAFNKRADFSPQELESGLSVPPAG